MTRYTFIGMVEDSLSAREARILRASEISDEMMGEFSKVAQKAKDMLLANLTTLSIDRLVALMNNGKTTQLLPFSEAKLNDFGNMLKGEFTGNEFDELLALIKTRKDLFKGLKTNINAKEIYPTSKLISDITGIRPQPNKAIVGKNAFAHESGIHQDGVLKHRETYEIINPADIGIEIDSNLILGKHSGRAAFKNKAKSLGFALSDDEIESAFAKFKVLCDSKKEVFDDDIREILSEQGRGIPQIFSLNMLQVSACSAGKFCAAMSMTKDGAEMSDSALGNGAVDSVLKSVDRISGIKGNLKEYRVESVTSGKDALAKVVVKVEFEPHKNALIGHGLDIDTMSATAKAYISALNSYLRMKEFL